MTFVWTDDKIAELIHYWNFERLPSARIADLLGVARNAVIGKAHRLKLVTRQTVVELQRKDPSKRPISRMALINIKKVRPPTPVPEITVLSSETNVTFEGLNPDHCRNIIGRQNGEPVYCGGRRLTYLNHYNREVLSPYCPVHHLINHQPSNRGSDYGRERYRQ